MKLLGMGMPEFLIILAVVLLIFGPKNLPKLGGAIGKTVKNLRDGLGGDKETTVAEKDATVAEIAEVADDAVDHEPSQKSTKKVRTVA